MYPLHIDYYFFLIFIWLRWVLVAAGGFLSCGLHVGSSSPARDRTWAPCIGSVESYPLRHQGSPLHIDYNEVFACEGEQLTTPS